MNNYYNEIIIRIKRHHPEVPIAAIKDAFLEGVQAFAWMKDGTTYVGTCGTRMAEVRAELEKIA